MALNDLIKLLKSMLPGADAFRGYENPEQYFISEACNQLQRLDDLEKIIGPDMSFERLRQIVEQDKNGDITIVQCRHKLAPLRLRYICSDPFSGTRAEWVHPEVPGCATLEYCLKCGAVFVTGIKAEGASDV